MTAQSMETIHIDGKKHWMKSEPFNQFLETMVNPPEIISPNTACWRGYYGNWKIRDDKLYLTKLKAYIKVDDKVDEVSLDYFFPDQKMVLASWFTGGIIVPDGKLIEYVHMGYESIYERDWLIQIEDGVVLSKNEILNITEQEKIICNFRFLINTLLTISLPAEQQIIKLGKYGVPLGISVYMDFHFEDFRDRYIQKGMLNEQEVECIDKLFNYMSIMYGEQHEEFWMDINQLKEHDYWKELRVLANGCIEVLKLRYDTLIQEIDSNPEEFL